VATAKEKLIASAQKLVEKGAFEKAIKEYLRVVQEDASDVRIWLKIGDLYAKIGKKQEATETYQRVAQFYSDQGFYLKSVAVYKQILKLDPRLVDVNQRLAELYKQLGLISDAISQYEQVAAFFHKEGKVREALSAMKQIVDLDPETVAARIKLAEMYSGQQMPREAIDEFTRAAEQLKEQGRTDEYMKVAERLLFHAPDNRPVTKELARLYIERNDPRHALPKLQVLFKADPRDLDVLRLLARAFEGLEQRPKAVSVYKELGRILTETGDQRGAVEVFQKILSIQPDDADAQQFVRNNPGLTRGPASPSPAVKKGASGQAPRFPTPPPLRPITAGGTPARTYATGAERALDSGGHRAIQSPAPREQQTVRPGMMPAPESESPEDVVQEEIAKILSETDVYIKYNLHAKAIEHLQRVFERAPRHTAAREKLKALFITTGKKDDAILELWALAEQAEPGRARRYVREIYELDSNNARAAQILGEPVGGTVRRPAPPEVADDFGVAPPDDFGLLNARKADPPTRRGHVVPEPEDEGEDLSFADALDVEDEVDADADLEVVEENAVALDPIGEVDPLAAGEDDDLIPVVIDTGSSRPVSVPVVDEDADRFSLDPSEDETSFASAGPDAETRFGGEIRGIVSAPPVLAFDGTEDATGTEQMADLPSFADISRPGFIEAGTQRSSVDELASFDDPSQPGFIEARTEQHNSDEVEIDIAPEPEVEITPEPQVVPTSGSLRRVAPIPEPIRADSSLEDDLDESEFFMAQSLFEEARGMLASLLERYPEHPLVSAKMRELEALEAAQVPPSAAPAEAESPFDPAPLEAVPEARSNPPEEFDSGEMQSLQHETPNGTVEVTRRGVIERGVSAEDFETHYDLGIAYKEMGLIEEAMNEFRQVMKDPPREVQCHLMLGLCYIEKQSYTEAINQFKKGLYVEGITDPEALSLYYELGQAYEKIGDPREALYYYDKVQKRDPKFRDLARRLRALRGEEPEVEPSSRSEDLDAAFDSLLEEG
jgi:tetratricopeptide (TPR) repeat protein